MATSFQISESQERYLDQLLTERGLEPHAAKLKATCTMNADVSSLITQLQRGVFGEPLPITAEQVAEIERLQTELGDSEKQAEMPTDQAGYSKLRRALLRASFARRSEAKANERAELIGVTLQAAADAVDADPWNEQEEAGVKAFA